MDGGLDFEEVVYHVFEAVCSTKLAQSSGELKARAYHRPSRLALEPCWTNVGTWGRTGTPEIS